MRNPGIDDDAIGALFAGASEKDGRELEALGSLRSSCVQTPSPAIEVKHLAAILAATHIPSREPHEPRSLVGRLRAVGLRTAAAVTSIALSTTGLAYAGVDLPGTATESLFRTVLGIELPNQEVAGETTDTEGSSVPANEAAPAQRDDVALPLSTPTPAGFDAASKRHATAATKCARYQAKTIAEHPWSQAKADEKCARKQEQTDAATGRWETRAARRSEKNAEHAARTKAREDSKSERKAEIELQKADKKSERERRKQTLEEAKDDRKKAKVDKQPKSRDSKPQKNGIPNANE